MKKVTLLCWLLMLASAPLQSQWSQLSVPTTEDLRSVHYRTNGNVWIGGFDTLYWSNDNGNSFQERPTMVGSAPLLGLYLAIHAFDNSTSLITGTMFTGSVEAIYRTTDAGMSWNSVHNADVDLIDILFDLEFAQAPLGFAVGSNGRILRSVNGGVSWTPVVTGTSWSLQRICWAGGSNYVAAGPSAFLHSTDGGLSWAQVSGPSGAVDLACSGPNCYAVSGSSIWHSTDAGVTWTVAGLSPGDVLEVLDANTIIVAGDEGMYRSSSEGQFWDQFDINGYQRVRQIDFHDAQNGIAVGENGYVLRTSNSGGSSLPLAMAIAPSGTVCTGVPVTITNGGDPSYSYSWSIDGVPQSTSYHLTTVFEAAGVHTVELQAMNGNGSDTFTIEVNVTASPVVMPFTAVAAQDTVCYSTSTTIQVPVSQTGVVYRLLREGAPQGNSILGGGVLSFATGAVSIPTLFSVIGVRTTPCGSDTFEVFVPIMTPYVPPGSTWSFSDAEGCSPYTPVVRVANSQVGFRYMVNNGPGYLGNGGVLDIPMSQVTGNTTVTAYVYVAFAGLSCNSVQIGGPQSLGVYMVNGLFNLAQDLGGDEQHALVGQLRTITHSPVATLSYEWDMGEGAVPSSYMGPSPPPVTYGTPGLKTVTLTTSSPMGICSAQLQRTILVVDSAALTDFPLCSSGTAGLGAYIADMCLDAYNNRYITGFHAIGNPMEFAFFAMKLDSSGNEVWRYMGPHSGSWQSGTGGSYGYGIAADQAGNAYITGRFDHDGREIQGTTVAHPNFLVKFDRFGQLEWQLTSPEAKMKGVQVVSDDTIYVAGYNVWSGVSFLLPSGDLEEFTVTPSDPGHGNAFLLAVDPQGGLLAYDPFGHVHPANEPSTMSSMDMSSDPLDTDDRFRCDPLLRVAPDGGLVVSGLMRTPQSGYSTKFDNVELVSYVTGATVYDRRQAFLVRYVPGSGVQSAFAVAGGDLRSIQGLSIDADGGAVLCGRFKSPLLFNGVSVEPQDPALFYGRYEHSYLLRIAPEGSPHWHWTGGNRFTMLHDVAIAPDNSVYALLGFTATGVLKGSNDQAVGFGSGSTDRDHAVIHLTSGGDLISADQGEYGSGVAYNMRPDPCGDLHTIVLTPASGPGIEHSWVSCDGCTDNLKAFVIDAGGCAQGCFGANAPGLRDVTMDALALSDTTSFEPEVWVSFRNVGQVPVQQVVIGYTINEGPVQYVVWDGGLAYTEGVTAVPLGMLSFLERHSNRVVAWIDQVNGTSDDLASNDTLRLTQVLCVEPLHGTYSCGANGSDFLTLAEATEALAVCGISASTTIAIAPGIYEEHLHVRPIPGVTPVDTVTFTSAIGDSSSVRLRFAPPVGSGVNAVIALDNNVKGVTMTNLTIDHASYGAGMTYGRYCEDLNIVRCRFQGRPFATQTALFGERASRRIRVDSCTFEFGSHGMHLWGWGSPPEFIDSLTWVRGNMFFGQRERAMFVEDHVGLVVQGNTIISDDVYNSSSYMAARILASGGLPSSFDGNYVKVSTTAPAVVGGTNPIPALIRLTFYSPSGVRSSVKNNMLFNTATGGTSVIPTILCSCSNVDYLHNTIKGVAILGSTIDSDSLVIRNNIFQTEADLYAVELSGAVQEMRSDNNLFSTGPNGSYSIVIKYEGYNRSLSWLQTNTGLDNASIQQLPQYVSADDVHLQAGANSFFCPSLPSVPTDIDGDQRGPIITRQGADEGDINVGLDNLGADHGLGLYPNPSTGRTVIGLPGTFNGPAWLDFFDAQGRLVHVVPMEKHSEEFAMDLDLEDGIYVVILRTGQGVAARMQLVITR